MSKYVKSIKMLSLFSTIAILLFSFQNCGQPGVLSVEKTDTDLNSNLNETEINPDPDPDDPETPPINVSLPDECAGFDSQANVSMSNPVAKRGSTTVNTQNIPFSIGQDGNSGHSSSVTVTTSLNPKAFKGKTVFYEFATPGINDKSKLNFMYPGMDGNPIRVTQLNDGNGIRLAVNNDSPICATSGEIDFQIRARAICESSNGMRYTKDVTSNLKINIITGTAGDSFNGCLTTTQVDEGADSQIDGANFGESVAIKGNIAAVGAKNYGSTNNGSAYIYQITNNSFSLKGKIVPPAGLKSGQLDSVAVGGTGTNNDVVYAGFPHVSTDSGKVYPHGVVVAYKRNSSGDYILSGTIDISNQHNSGGSIYTGGDNFGAAVATSGNLLAVGAPGDSSFSGAVHIYSYSGSSWTHCSKIQSPSGNQFFGEAVAMSGSNLVVGGSGVSRAGKAFLYSVSGCSANNFNLVHSLQNPSSSSTDKFGQSVSVSGNSIVVGAPKINRAFLYNTTMNNPTQTLSGDGSFGISVSVDSASKQVVVGALDDDGQGSAYYYSLNNSSDNPNYKIMDHSRKTGGKFGSAVAISNGLAIIGSKNDNPAKATQAGSAFIVDLP